MKTLHVIGLPHAPTTKEHCACAYTAKNYKFCKMMKNLGYRIFHYGVEGSDPECDENIITLTKEQHSSYFKGHDYKKTYYPVVWDSNLPYWQISNNKAVEEIKKRYTRGDFVCVLGGICNKPISDGLKDYPILTVEYGVGYYGIFSDYRVFESYAHMHTVYGKNKIDDGKFFDAVIPNYFDTDDFTFNEEPKDYFLFIGRMIRRKGIEIAVEATRRTNKKLLLCGQGVKDLKVGKIFTEDGEIYSGDHLKYVGFADVEKRNHLMRNAKAVIVPSLYLEPFGGVAVENMLTGTPVISSDWGAFPETNVHGVTGYRCRTLEQFTWAIDNIDNIDRKTVYNRAKSLYSLEKIGLMYDEYFSMLSTLWTKGWYEEKKERTNLNWLNNYF